MCGLGHDVSGVFEKMCAGQTAFKDIYGFNSEPYAQKKAGQISMDDYDFIIEKYPTDDLAHAMVKYAAEQALDGRSASPSRALVLATNFGPMSTLQWSWEERIDTYMINEGTYDPANNYIRRLADILGCGGPAMQLSMSCASGAAALAAAWDYLESGRAESVLVVAYDSLTEYCWCGLSNLHTITTDVMRPFDVHRSGTIFSEGAAAVLLEKADSGTEPIGWLNGIATGNNAFHLTAPRHEAAGSRQVMEAAIARAGLSAADIDHVCAHATSTNANDVTEAAAIRNIFGERINEITVVAHKSQLGHGLGAAGLSEIIITLEAMRKSLIPPTVNLNEPDPKCMPLNCVTGSVAKPHEFHMAVTNSAGIGGNNAATVVGLYNTKGMVVNNAAPIVGTYNASYARIDFVQNSRYLYVRKIGCVLPQYVGTGELIMFHPEWFEKSYGTSKLDGFNAKLYINSVKGYLDDASKFFLAAASMTLESPVNTEFNPRFGVASGTCFGSCASAFTFFSQLKQKGPRLASPMIFPHGYANTPGNLAAIEFGCGGPHTVLYGQQNMLEVLSFAYARLTDGTADEMLAGVYEATIPQAFPDDFSTINGAIVLRVATTPSPSDMAILDMDALQEKALNCKEGAIEQFGNLLTDNAVTMLP